jgi:hypothetical protein
VSSTRRFWARPCGVSFGATGSASPRPRAEIRVGLTLGNEEIRNDLRPLQRKLLVAVDPLRAQFGADRNVIRVAGDNDRGLLARASYGSPSKAKTRRQSFFMLITTQPCLVASSYSA